MRETLSSRSNPLVKRICSLDEKKHRNSEGLFRFDGIKLFLEALDNGVELEYAVLSDNASEKAREAVYDAVRRGRIGEGIIVPVTESVFEKISTERSPEGIISVARMLGSLHKELSCGETADALGQGERILMLESVRDPGNLGTVIRSAAALGIERLVVSSDTADLYNPKTIRAAMGAIFRLPTLRVCGGSLSDVINAERRKGRAVYAAALTDRSRSIAEIKLERGDCFVIGNEGHGLSAETVEACTDTVIIPMTEGSESLNASAAAAICIWETVRRA